MDGYAEFEFDLLEALKTELVRLLEGIASEPLRADIAAGVPEEQGIYQLFYDGELAYIGKTDTEAGLRTRLSRHARKILHRPTLTGGVRFKAARIMVFTAMDLETQLIKHYRQINTRAASWNGSGFGSNDPGRERETTNKDPEGFDTLHPISIDLPVQMLAPGNMSAAQALAELKRLLPYTLRYEVLRSSKGKAMPGRPHPDLLAANITIPSGSQSVRGLMRLICGQLGRQWQATSFASHAILYKENRSYKFGSAI